MNLFHAIYLFWKPNCWSFSLFVFSNSQRRSNVGFSFSHVSLIGWWMFSAEGLSSDLLPAPPLFSFFFCCFAKWQICSVMNEFITVRMKREEEVSERLHASHLPLLFSLIKMHLLGLLAALCIHQHQFNEVIRG